ncbi:hypothetical protein ACHAXT_009337 [Thalassiosira profunda]
MARQTPPSAGGGRGGGNHNVDRSPPSSHSAGKYYGSPTESPQMKIKESWTNSAPSPSPGASYNHQEKLRGGPDGARASPSSLAQILHRGDSSEVEIVANPLTPPRSPRWDVDASIARMAETKTDWDVAASVERLNGSVTPEREAKLPPTPALRTPPKKKASPHAASPKSLAVAQSIAESKRASRQMAQRAEPESWFRYTNGTLGGSVASSKSQSPKSYGAPTKPPANTSPRTTGKSKTMAQLELLRDKYATPKRTNVTHDTRKSPGSHGTDADEGSALSGIGDGSVESRGLSLGEATEALARYRSEGRATDQINRFSNMANKDASPVRANNGRSTPTSQSNRLPQTANTDVTPLRTNGARKSQPTSPLDDATPKGSGATCPNPRNMWKEMSRANSGQSQPLPPAMPGTKPYGKSVPRTSNTSPPITKKTVDSVPKASRWAATHNPAALNQSANTSTQQKAPPKPLSKVGSAVKLPQLSTASKSMSVRHGGTPVWIHTSILRDGKSVRGDEWEWVRGYIHASSDDGMAVTVDDSNAAPDLNGHRYTISKKHNDGAHILMGNAWWSCQSPSPSPTSISQQIDGSHGMPPRDLVELTHLHEPAIVHALRTRYEQDIIYTNTGAILLAVNPFKKLDNLYTRETMELYWEDDTDEGDGEDPEPRAEKPPHAYAVAERAYSSMLRSLEERDTAAMHFGELSGDEELPPCNQSILVSGESGAGKTVTTKIIMRYLSILSQRHSHDEMNQGAPGAPSVEMQVLQSNPILESFGNARTIRNDNSSRFGKFIEMSFASHSNPSSSKQRGSLLGACIDFYLLEKVRLVSVNPGERNYHIFYELLSPQGLSLSDKRRYMLTSNFGRNHTLSTVDDFRMTAMSGTFDRRDGVDDAVTYGELRTAMNTVGFSFNEQDGIFSVVAALLHASNLRFVGDDSDGSDYCIVYAEDGTSHAVSQLLGVSEESLNLALTSSILEARGEALTKRLTMAQATKALEATVKATYGALFSYIVARINSSIEVHGDTLQDTAMSDVRRAVATIGVLDIFGFESFDHNSFEQLCINYCNEALQQQFNRFVFKAEQAEYEAEGIEWANIEFPDNQEALDLIEAKRVGIFSVLDEQCRLPRRTDQTFAKAIYDTCAPNGYFVASSMQQSHGRFAILHYAGEVEYDRDSFLLKNKDELPKSASGLLASSTIQLVSELASILGENEPSRPQPSGTGLKRSASALTRATVSGQFKEQLKDLRARIETTGPHYIRCLKPNDILEANHFDATLIAHQLNCAGVIPAMKIARSGFAMRYLHTSFIQRYRPIVGQELRRRSRNIGGHQVTCQYLLSLLSERLESLMKDKSSSNSKLDEVSDIVSWGVQIGRSKVFLRTAAFEALEELRNAKLNQAAIILQAQARAFLCQSRFYLILGSVLTLQCAARKLIASVFVHRLRCHVRSITIQKYWRGYDQWCHFQNVLYIATWCQRLWKGRKVREKYVVIKQYRGAIAIQSAWRCRSLQSCHKEVRSAAVTIQCFVRARAAMQELTRLKREAKDMKGIAMERDRLRMELQEMQRELHQVKHRHHAHAIERSDSWSTAKTTASQEDQIRRLAEEVKRKDRELQSLRREVECLRGNGRSVPSTLPLTVTLDAPSGQSSRHSPVDLALLPSGESSLTKSVGKPPVSPGGRISRLMAPLAKSVGILPHSPSLLDQEVAEDVPQLDSTQISLPDSSVESESVNLNLSAFDHPADSSFIDCAKIEELPFHQAVQNDDKEMLLAEIQNSSDVELGINAADSKGRTPLHIAVECSNLELVNILLSHDAVANTQDFSGNTPLHYAESPEVTRVLLEGGISPNIPNGDGLCSLHLAVKRRDFISVKHLLSHGADVNNADDEYWYTPLHLVAHAESPDANASSHSLRGPIAELLCEPKGASVPDLNYQDRDGNTPLHHATSLAEEDAGILISLFIEHGSCPKVANHRGQTPIHLFCHNHTARQYVFYHEALHLMLVKGADPNAVSLSGCTALHLALYHGDVGAAALLVKHGAQLNMQWTMPQRWEAFWTDMGSEDVFPLDMLEDDQSLCQVLAEISTPQRPAPRRARCMHCKTKHRMFGRHHNCTHCGRSVCGKCCAGSMKLVCTVCEPILQWKIDRVPTTIVGRAGVDDQSLGTISM